MLVAAAALARHALADPVQDYQRFCAACHGTDGKGGGPVAAFLAPPPRDFTKGSYKFRSTAGLPREADIVRVVDEGLPGTSMPGWRGVLTPERERALAGLVKGFSPRFRGKAEPAAMELPAEPPSDPQAAVRGRAVYEKMKCAECHGAGGRGDGPSVPTLKDDWGRPIVPSDLTRLGRIRRASPIDVVAILITGLTGTPMPSYAEAATPGEVWDLVRYLVSLRRPVRPLAAFFLDEPLAWSGDAP